MGQAQTKIKKNKIKSKNVHKFESKEEYFIKNGGILLKKQIALSQGQNIVRPLKILSQEEIKNATNNYDPNLIFGRTSEANAYKARLDDRLVFVKTPKERDLSPELVDLFLTELSISMVMRHDNMSTIYGCCLETYVPMIVYLYAPRKILHTYLYDDVALREPMNWRHCLKVASDVAYALSYMHNGVSKSVVHRDIKSFFILIDSSFHATLTSVSHAVCITPGKKDKTWPVHGTPGYIDPEYIETQEVTDKCDVYSFGVLMLELLTARDPIEMAKCGKDLVIEFCAEAERSCVVDLCVVDYGNIVEVQRFARLALRCVAKKGEERPSMINVVEELWRIKNKDTNVC